MPKPGDADKTNKLIDKYKIDKASKKTDIGAEKKILDAQQDPNLKKLDKINKAQDNAIKSLSKQGVDLTAKPGKTTNTDKADKNPEPQKPRKPTRTKKNQNHQENRQKPGIPKKPKNIKKILRRETPNII